jgi:hypothetical protein
MHNLRRHNGFGDAVLGDELGAEVPALDGVADAGAVVLLDATGYTPVAWVAAGVVLGDGLDMVVGRTTSVVSSCGLAVAVGRGRTATGVFACGPFVVGGRVGCQATARLGRVDAGAVVPDSVAVAGETGSGIEATFPEPVEDPAGSATIVRPPPMRATALAAAARRRFFFQRSICRRRSARPGPPPRAALPAQLDESAPDPSTDESPRSPESNGVASEWEMEEYGAREENSSGRYPSPVVAGISAVVCMR